MTRPSDPYLLSAGFRYDRSIKDVVPSRSADVEAWEPVRADGAVVRAVTASREIAAALGDRLNVYPVKGYSITVHLDDPASREAAPWVGILDDADEIVTSRLGQDRFRVAGRPRSTASTASSLTTASVP